VIIDNRIKYATDFEKCTRLVFHQVGDCHVDCQHSSFTVLYRYSYRMSSVCLSFRPYVTLVDCDHTGWNSSKIILRLDSLGCALSADQTSCIYSKGNTSKCWPEYGTEYGKKVAFSTQELSERRQDRNEDTIEEQQEFALSIDAKINDLG